MRDTDKRKFVGVLAAVIPVTCWLAFQASLVIRSPESRNVRTARAMPIGTAEVPGVLALSSEDERFGGGPVLSVFAIRDTLGRPARLGFTGRHHWIENSISSDELRLAGEICSAIQYGTGSDWTLIGSVAGLTDWSDPHVIAAFQADGLPRWVWKSESGAIRSVAPLYLNDGLTGFVCSLEGELAIRQFDLHGNQVATIQDRRPALMIATHVRLPGVVLRLGGPYRLLRIGHDANNPTVLIDDGIVDSVKRRPRGTGLWADLGMLVPGIGDMPDGALLAGLSEPHDTPFLARVDFSDNELWRVKLPARAVGIARINVEDGDDVVCLSTADGVVYLVDEFGSMLDSLQLSEPAVGGDGVRIPLAAGASSGERGWAFVRVRSGAELISIDLEGVKKWRSRR